MAKILIVDDDPKARRLLVDLLEYEGHLVIERNNGAEALEAAERDNPDLVITDSRMPGVNGMQFVAGLRNLARTLHTPIIFHTASGDEGEIRETAIAYGISQVLTKPCPAKEILAAVKSTLNAPRPKVFRPPERLRRRIPAYLASCAEDAAAMELALAADDLGSIQDVAHNLKGTGAAYGFSHITWIGDRMESAAKTGDLTELSKRLTDLSAYLRAVKSNNPEIADRADACSRCVTRNLED